MGTPTNRIYVLAILTAETAKFTVPILIQVSDSSTARADLTHVGAEPSKIVKAVTREIRLFVEGWRRSTLLFSKLRRARAFCPILTINMINGHPFVTNQRDYSLFNVL